MAHPEARLQDEVRIKAYPVEELGGLLWAYLGPEPRPLVPDWEFFSWKNGFRQIVNAEIPCNWFQCQENSIDPVHFEWTHSNWSVRLEGEHRPLRATACQGRFQRIRVRFPVQAHPHRYERRGRAVDDRPRLPVAECALHRQSLSNSACRSTTRTRSAITWHFSRVPREREPYVQNSIPTWQGPISDPATGRWITSHVMNQDFVDLGRPGRDRRPQQELPRAERSRHRHDPPPFSRTISRRSRRARIRRRSCATRRSTAQSFCRSPSASADRRENRAEFLTRPARPPRASKATSSKPGSRRRCAPHFSRRWASTARRLMGPEKK